MAQPEQILAFWLDEVSPSQWYGGSEELDAEIKTRFLDSWDASMAGRYGLWLTYPSGTLAYLILTDQFPRNMFRGTPRAFASDRRARSAAKAALGHGFDLRIDLPARQFFYTPLMHSENLCDQDRCVRLMHERLGGGAAQVLHARAHREIIRQYGRFPSRNQALARRDLPREVEFHANGGYGNIVERLQRAG